MHLTDRERGLLMMAAEIMQQGIEQGPPQLKGAPQGFLIMLALDTYDQISSEVGEQGIRDYARAYEGRKKQFNEVLGVKVLSVRTVHEHRGKDETH